MATFGTKNVHSVVAVRFDDTMIHAGLFSILHKKPHDFCYIITVR